MWTKKENAAPIAKQLFGSYTNFETRASNIGSMV